MPKFKVTITRDVTTTESVEREIEADNRAEALAVAQDLASSFDSDCPDDATEDSSGYDFGSWTVNDGPLDVEEIVPAVRKWRVEGRDRIAGALGVTEPFSIFVNAATHDDAQNVAISARNFAGREHVTLSATVLAE